MIGCSWMLIIITSCISTINTSVQGPVFYVTPAGNDAASGTSRDHAWKTIARVNQCKLAPGSAVLFEGGQTYTGTLELNRQDSARADHRILISSYGSGLATIDGGNGAGLRAKDCNNFTVKKLRFRGNGRNDGNRSDGVLISGCIYAEIDSVEVSGFQHAGLGIFKCSHVRITHVNAHDNGFAGINVSGTTIWDTGKYDNEDLYIAYCRASNNPGDPTVLDNHSGNGILASSVKGGIIEYCEAFNNGWDMPWHGNGPVGIWIWDCTGFRIQYCISHDNKTSAGASDGGGFDLDGGVSNSVIQYCLSYHNQGPGIGLFEFGAGKVWENNVVRYNISRNDGTNGQGSLSIWKGEAGGTIRNCEIYNNTFYNSNPNGPNLCFMNNWTGFSFSNNVFVYRGSVMYKGKVIRDEVFRNNCYWNLTGQASFMGYDNIQKWAAATGKEMKDGNCTLVYADPLFEDTGSLMPTDPLKLKQGLSGFRPGASSPLIDAGFDIRSLPSFGGLNTDISGTEVPRGKGFDIGALEYVPR
jgi:hypothetical protein